MTAINRVDIRQGETVLAAYIGNTEILSKHKGRPWAVGDDVELSDIITAAVTLMDFCEGRHGNGNR